MKKIKNYIIPVLFVFIVYGCAGPEGDYPGTEYMPDMAHSVAYEANLYDYYYYNTWGSEEDYYKFAQPRKPVANTIARGHAGIAAGDDVRAGAMQGIAMNGAVPYHYEDTEEERTRASAEIISNPYPITTEGLARGKNLYEINCAICHGSKGDGEGYLVSEKNPNAVYPAQPAILTSDDFINASNGQLYHALIYGKNVMGGYADKLSYEERWQVIHYVRSLQAKEKKLAYNEEENTLTSVALPLAAWKQAHNKTHAHADADGQHHHADSDENDAEGHHGHGHEGHDTDGGHH